jgi:hypothetical protein
LIQPLLAALGHDMQARPVDAAFNFARADLAEPGEELKHARTTIQNDSVPSQGRNAPVQA